MSPNPPTMKTLLLRLTCLVLLAAHANAISLRNGDQGANVLGANVVESGVQEPVVSIEAGVDSGFCLVSPHPSNRQPLSLEKCDKKSQNQHWLLESDGRIKHVGTVYSKCVHVEDPHSSVGTVFIYDCDPKFEKNQVFTMGNAEYPGWIILKSNPKVRLNGIWFQHSHTGVHTYDGGYNTAKTLKWRVHKLAAAATCNPTGTKTGTGVAQMLGPAPTKLSCLDYSNNEDVSWSYTSPVGTLATLRLDEFNTEPEGDELAIFDGHSGSKITPLRGDFGMIKDSYFMILATSNKMALRFTTNDKITAPGFVARLDSVTPVLLGPEPTTLSKLNYGNNEDITWLYTTPPGTLAVVDVVSLQMGDGLDFLDVIDGVSGKRSDRLPNYSHNTKKFTMSSNVILFRFYSNARHTGPGFTLKLDSIPTYNIETTVEN